MSDLITQPSPWRNGNGIRVRPAKERRTQVSHNWVGWVHTRSTHSTPYNCRYTCSDRQRHTYLAIALGHQTKEWIGTASTSKTPGNASFCPRITACRHAFTPAGPRCGPQPSDARGAHCKALCFAGRTMCSFRSGVFQVPEIADGRRQNERKEQQEDAIATHIARLQDKGEKRRANDPRSGGQISCSVGDHYYVDLEKGPSRLPFLGWWFRRGRPAGHEPELQRDSGEDGESTGHESRCTSATTTKYLLALCDRYLSTNSSARRAERGGALPKRRTSCASPNDTTPPHTLPAIATNPSTSPFQHTGFNKGVGHTLAVRTVSSYPEEGKLLRIGSHHPSSTYS